MKATAANEPIRMRQLAAIQQGERAFRTLIDAIEELGVAKDALGRGVGGREIALAVTNFEQGEMWLARALALASDDLRSITE